MFDCINARILLPPQEYFPGIPCPPHLSPFVEEKEGEYVPEEKVKFLKRMRGEIEEDEQEEEDSEGEEAEDSEEEGNLEGSAALYFLFLLIQFFFFFVRCCVCVS